MKEVNTNRFKTDVLNSSIPVVVVIWGVGWGFCRALKPQVEVLAEELESSVKFYKMEIGPNRELLIELNVSGLPTFLFYNKGQQASFLAGKNILLDEIKDHTEKLLRSVWSQVSYVLIDPSSFQLIHRFLPVSDCEMAVNDVFPNNQSSNWRSW